MEMQWTRKIIQVRYVLAEKSKCCRHQNAITKFTPLPNHLGRKLTLKITGVKGTAEDFEGFTYETPAVTITAKDVKVLLLESDRRVL